jgi:23S rRNA (cytidine1920-2'-O)/16S rRNA (cytidine1409-2'-O)-methyltransferase
MSRADIHLVGSGLVASRSQAQRLITAGQVEWLDVEGHWHTVSKSNLLLPESCTLRLTEAGETRYVSRGGLKLAGALAHTGMRVENLTCLDIGQSTGGFTDCLLQQGAARVIGVDVGHGQLHAQLLADPRVVCVEKVNARALPVTLLQHNQGEAFPFSVMDVSFISQTLILTALASLLAHGSHILALVKPQFEASPEDINKQGLIKKTDTYARVEQRIREAYGINGFDVLDYFPCAITGGDGNREYFIYARKC